MRIGYSRTKVCTCTSCNGTGLQEDDYHGMYAQEEYADQTDVENILYQCENQENIYCQVCDGKGYVEETLLQVDGEYLRIMEE